MATFAFGKWTFGVNLSTLLTEAKGPRGRLSSTLNHLGADTTTQNTRVAEIVNRAIEEFILANPRLGLKDTNVSVSSGSSFYNVPTDLLGTAIRHLQYADGQDAGIDLVELDYLNDQGVRALPANMKNGEITADWPRLWGLSINSSQIVLYPEPSTASTITVEYQQAYAAITAANVLSPSGVTISEIPAMAQRCLALRIAMEIQQDLSQEGYDRLESEYMAELRKWQRRFGDTGPARRSNGRGTIEASQVFEFAQ